MGSDAAVTVKVLRLGMVMAASAGLAAGALFSVATAYFVGWSEAVVYPPILLSVVGAYYYVARAITIDRQLRRNAQ